MSESIDIVVKATDQASATLGKVGQAFTGMNQAVELAQKAYAMYDKVVGEAMRQTVSYANEVRRLQQITGGSAESVSRLAQTADDLKISTEALMAAQKRLAKEGISLTTDELAKLSDQYKAIRDPAEKAIFLQDKFGRSGFQFAEAMEKGGEEIRNMAASQSANMIMTQKQVDEARKYEQAVDAAQDAWKGIQYTIGNAVLPATTNLINAMTGSFTIEDRLKSLNAAAQTVNGRGNQETSAARIRLKELKETPEYIEWAKKALSDYRAEERGAGADSANLAMTEEELIENLEEKNRAIIASNQAFIEQAASAREMTSASAEYAAKQEEIRNKQAAINAEIARMKAWGYSEAGTKIQGLRGELEALDESLQSNTEAWEKNAAAIVYANMQKQAVSEAGAGGVEITELEKQAMEDFAVSAGLASAASFALADAYTYVGEKAMAGTISAERMDAVVRKIANWPEGKKLTLEVVEQWIRETGGGGGVQNTGNTRTNVQAMAAGGGTRGLFWAGDTMGGLTPHSELIYAPRGAYVFNAAQSRRIAARHGGMIPRYPTGGPISDDPTVAMNAPGGHVYPSESQLSAYLTEMGQGGTAPSMENYQQWAGQSSAAVTTAAAVSAATVAPVAQATRESSAVSVKMAAETAALAGQIATSQARSEALLAAIDMRLAAMPSQIRDGMQQIIR